MKSATGYASAIAAVIACTLVGWTMSFRFDLVNIAMVYLLAVVVIAFRFSTGPATIASVLSVAAFDFFFVPPQGTFAVTDAQHLLTFAIMLAVALLISHLADRVRRNAREHAQLAGEAENERMRNALLASISHDMRTPLAVISGASSSLAEKGPVLPEPARQDLALSIYRQSMQMSHLVANILQMTRLEGGAIELKRDWEMIGDIAGPVLARLRGTLAKHILMVELPDDLPLVRVDASLIDQVLANLLENAAKYTQPGTLVRLRAQRRAGELFVSVEDRGPGLPEGDFERLFAKFQRGQSESAVAGIGLGLAICRAIVRLHGGKIWAEQLPGGGTAFSFTLPLEEAPPVPLEAPA